jgi:tetrahydromethanopterin S-methyltransferase subunit G
MVKTNDSTSLTIRLPQDLANSIEAQAEQTRQNKTDVTISMLLSSIPSLHITERAKLPPTSGIYFVYTPDHNLLYIGKADNLRTRWNSHHKYQYFIESSTECRIGYFTFDSIDSLSETIEEFKAEPTQTTTGKALVTADQFEELKQQVEAIQQQFNNTFSTLTQLGIDVIAKKLEVYQPPRGLQQWNYTLQDQREGTTRSDLIKRLGFDSTKAFEDTAVVLELDPIKYLSELSGWQNRPVEEGSSRTRFFPPK